MKQFHFPQEKKASIQSHYLRFLRLTRSFKIKIICRYQEQKFLCIQQKITINQDHGLWQQNNQQKKVLLSSILSTEKKSMSSLSRKKGLLPRRQNLPWEQQAQRLSSP